jgi:hypothetical protein
MLNARYAGFTVAKSHHQQFDADTEPQRDDKVVWLTLSLRKRQGLQPRTSWFEISRLPNSAAEFLTVCHHSHWRSDLRTMLVH